MKRKDYENNVWYDVIDDAYWDDKSFKPTTCLKDLIKAGALIAAAIDRLQK